MSYKLETHVHTIVSSSCGHSTPAEMVNFYKKAGYDGICVTEHFYLGNTNIPTDLPWTEWVDAFLRAYRSAKAEGDRIGLDVFFGWETSYRGEDFLIYGLDGDWLFAHPEIISWDQKEQYEHVRADGGFVVQAHPFRERSYMKEVKLHPYHADAWEVFNACNEPYENRLAYEVALEYGLPMTAGSDIHRVGETKTGFLFGVEFDEDLPSIQAYKDRILSGNYRLIADWSELKTECKNPYFDVTVFNETHERKLVETPYYPGALKAETPELRSKENKEVNL